MKTIRKGDRGAQVKRWQFFLVGLDYTYIFADGDFGPLTHKATKDFQSKNNLVSDGIVGKNTYLKAFSLGYNVKESRDWPKKPEFRPLVGNRARARIFGDFTFRAKSPGSDDIVVTDGWARENIVKVKIPQLKGVKHAPRNQVVWFHKLAAEQLKAMFQEWEDEGLTKLILTYHGSYVPRFVRGRWGVLSNHAFGSAFDINYAWNRLGRESALVGEKGSVRELVPIAHKHGFYWGGHFTRKDGMHFEVAVLK